MTLEEVYKQKLLETFRYLIDFLNAKGLRWLMAYGSMIGAVRHHGIIPWDDDIDIWMPREDYQRLLSYKPEFENGKYSIGHLSLDTSYGARFMKVMDMTTTIQARSFIPSVMGVFIDVFPLDSSNEDKDIINGRIAALKKQWDKYFDCFEHYPMTDLIKQVKHPLVLLRHLLVKINSGSKRLSDLRRAALEADISISQAAFDHAKYYICPYGFVIFDSELFKSYNVVPFEGMTVRIPSGYHTLLTDLYGDYMTPPPIEKRVPRHLPYYANLKERLSLHEISQRVKRGENIVY